MFMSAPLGRLLERAEKETETKLSKWRKDQPENFFTQEEVDLQRAKWLLKNVLSQLVILSDEGFRAVQEPAAVWMKNQFQLIQTKQQAADSALERIVQEKQQQENIALEQAGKRVKNPGSWVNAFREVQLERSRFSGGSLLPQLLNNGALTPKEREFMLKLLGEEFVSREVHGDQTSFEAILRAVDAWPDNSRDTDSLDLHDFKRRKQSGNPFGETTGFVKSFFGHTSFTPFLNEQMRELIQGIAPKVAGSFFPR
ncbi:MAG: hypothetical protein A2103_04550 [Gammaproteobacteria bacterium GWF2_41_13]|nr:MAG: hypothetical protein A2103_04550 [Gammaproteobacteria bacterium GWF2_41_13]